MERMLEKPRKKEKKPPKQRNEVRTKINENAATISQTDNEKCSVESVENTDECEVTQVEYLENSTCSVENTDEFSTDIVSEINEMKPESSNSKVLVETNQISKCETITQESGKLDSILRENKQIINRMSLNDMEIKSVHKKEPIKIVIKPYTEQQLEAFYTNSELSIIEQFSQNFIEAELKSSAIKNHPLYELLSNYLHVREKVIGNNLELSQLKREYESLQEQLYHIGSHIMRGSGVCLDSNTVTASHSYNKATLRKSCYESLIRVLSKLHKCTHENHVLYSYTAEDLQLQIEIYIQTTILNCELSEQKNRNVVLIVQEEPVHLRKSSGELRLCISVLFAFQRKLLKDSQFVKETREWLTQLIAVLLRMASCQDHLFILNHVLRCPAGVSSWATKFIQMPLMDDIESPFLSYEINHILTVLSVILSPIRERDKFLEDIAQMKDSAQDALWVMVDSDGEEDEEPSGTSLRENDLVALLNQIPLENLFRSLLLIKKKDFNNFYDDESVSEHHILRFFAFCTTLMKIINKGLLTYNYSRYNQFSKRLSRFIRHIVQYATDQWERFKKNQKNVDPAMMERLQVEYDVFFLRAVYYLYSSQKLGAWQFLAVVPYDMVSIDTLWKIFHFLHDSEDSCAENLLTRSFEKSTTLSLEFTEKLSDLTDAEVYYLLNTFANMALARTEQDFIKIACMDLLQIGFIDEKTQDICSKTSKILLVHLTSKHPHLLSNILKKVKENTEKIGDLSLYLYEELPLSVWKITENDFEILSKLILTSNMLDSKLGRMILSRLNWGFEGTGHLFLSYEMHCKVAILVLQAVDLEPNVYSNWGWQTILRLKLHLSDKGLNSIINVKDISSYDIIFKGVRDKKTLHSFVSLLLTSWGHLVPLICTKGLGQLLFLQSQQKHEAVLFALYVMMPLFVESQECIINCLEFQEILTNLLNADHTYTSIARALIGTSSTVLQQFGNMIETQITNFSAYNLGSPRFLVRLWMNSLVSVANWTKNYGVLYLLDVIIRASFFESDTFEVCEQVLKDLVEATTPQEEGGAFSSIFKWVSTSNANPSLVSSSLSPFPWLAYMIIRVEHSEREAKTGLWKEILLQLNLQKKKVNVDAAIKKAANFLKIPAFSSASLCIYRYAQQALDTPVDHPLLVLMWQNFFLLYLQRIRTSSSMSNLVCVGEKFFEGLINFAFLKKMKRKLQETVKFYENKVENLEKNEENIEDVTFFKSCLKIFKAFELWLEEPRMQEATLMLPILPIQYETAMLFQIIQGNTEPWYKYVNYKKVNEYKLESIRVWRISNYRDCKNVNKPLANPANNIESEDPCERISRRLQSYDSPKIAPEIPKINPIIPSVDMTNLEAMFKGLKPHFNILKQFAHNQLLRVSEHKELNCAYLELIPQLYHTVVVKITKSVLCNEKNKSVQCSGAAKIHFAFEDARIDERIQILIENNRSAYEHSLTSALKAPAASLCFSTVTIQHTIKILQKQIQCNPETAELGVELFYYILSMLNEETTSYLPTKTFFVTCLERLGQSHICGVEFEMPRLLQRIILEPNLGEHLAPHFSPSNIGTANLLLMYQSIAKEITEKYDVSFALLSKFDIENWLVNKNPKLNQRSQFIEIVINVLAILGNDPPIEALTLHGLYRKHLIRVFEFQFPEHYGEILISLLRSSSGTSETPPLALSVWVDILNSLANPAQIHIKVPMKEQLRFYALNQKRLQHQEILETLEMLAAHFTNERLQFGLYGLYPKCRFYLNIYAFLLGMTGHAFIVSSLNTHQGLMSDKLCEKVWPFIRNMFAPWIAPYALQNIKENMASWIQQLTDDRSILLPWIPADVQSAQKILDAFQECILFLLHVLPACNIILNHIWQWYFVTYAHSSVTEHVLEFIHKTLLVLPWQNFWPTLNDLDAMLRVVDQYLPECHQFLGNIFISVQWTNWMNFYANSPVQIKTRVFQCFINLLVKLSNEPNIRSRYVEKFNILLVQSEHLNWQILEPNVFQHVMDWYIMSCDSNVIFKSDPMDLDCRVLHFLKVVSSYEEILEQTENLSDKLNKRYIFVRSYVKLVSVFTSRHKLSVPSKANEVASVINAQIKHLENVVKTREEMDVILFELLHLLNITNIEDISLKCVTKWISNKPGNDIAVETLLKISSEAVSDLENISRLYEIALETYFQNVNGHYDASWEHIRTSLRIPVRKQVELEQVLLQKGCILTLHAVLLQKEMRISDYNMLNQCINWLSDVKINESVECKLPLIWIRILKFSLKYAEIDEAATSGLLYKFSQILFQMSEDKGNSSWGRGLLNVIGIVKTESSCLQYRFLCRALGGFILAQLPEMRGEPQVIRKVPNAPFKVGQPGGNTECAKILLKLDFGQSQGKIKECAELALNKIQDGNNSLHNSIDFLVLLVKHFYNKTFFKNVM